MIALIKKSQGNILKDDDWLVLGVSLWAGLYAHTPAGITHGAGIRCNP